jgi:hypothetical protein
MCLGVEQVVDLAHYFCIGSCTTCSGWCSRNRCAVYDDSMIPPGLYNQHQHVDRWVACDLGVVRNPQDFRYFVGDSTNLKRRLRWFSAGLLGEPPI